MTNLASRAATYQDLLQVPNHFIAEIINGELHTQPRPAAKHALSASTLGGELFSPFHKGGDNKPGGWIILFEPELHLGKKPDIMVPDLAGWRKQHMPVVPDVAWFDLPPDWICEVISPASTFKDRVLKMPIYGEQGVEWLWLVDPEHRTLEAYQLINKRWTVLGTWGDNDLARIEPFDAIEIPLKTLWL